MDAGDLSSIIPIGTVTGMLAIIMVAFIRDSARQDERVDRTANQLVEAAKLELEAGRKREELLQQALVDSELRCEGRLKSLERDVAVSKKFLYERIRHLETMLYGESISTDTFPGPEEEGA